MEQKDHEPAFLLPLDDYLAELPMTLTSSKPREVALRVGRSYGRRIATELVEPLPSAQAAAEAGRNLVLMLTAAEVTVLLEPSPTGQDFIACELWSNEKLPLGFISHRQDFYVPESAEQLAPVFLDFNEGIWFARECEGCGGRGKVGCHACTGSGEVTCDKCHGSGIFKPAAPCNRCEGRGTFKGKYGDQMPCRPCGGTGRFPQKNCLPCGGRGKRQCPLCHGAKILPCRNCAGAGCTRVHFDHVAGAFSQRRESGKNASTEHEVSPGLVFLYDRANGTVLPPSGDPRALREKLCTAYEKIETHTNVFEPLWREHVRTIGSLTNCLTLSMEVADRRESQVKVANAEASSRRSSGSLCLDVSVFGDDKSWIDQGLLPIPEGDEVRIFAPDDHQCLHSISLPMQGNTLFSEQDSVVEVDGCRGAGDSYRLTLRFPRALDPHRLLTRFYIKHIAPPAAELAQKKVLTQWCSPENRDFPALNAIISPREGSAAPRLPLYAGRINSGNPPQGKALALALSDSPLSLVKGPPGTGKTTLIEEIVNQVIAKGGRVLVCSQSHDAVRNVLENLHGKRKPDSANPLRMLRYGREEKLSEVELSYSVDQLERTYPQLVRSRTGLRQAILAASVEQSAALASLLDTAIAAAENLDATRAKLEQAHTAAHLQHREWIEALEGAQHAGLTQSQQLYEAESSGPAGDLQAHTARLTQLASEQPGLEEDVTNARERFRAKTGRDPQVVAVSDGTGRKLRDLFVPSFLVGADVMEQRYSAAWEAARKCAMNIQEEQLAIGILQENLSVLAATRDRRDEVIRQQAIQSRMEADHALEAHLAEWRAAVATEESRTFPVFQRVRAALPFGFDAPDAEMSAASWQEVRCHALNGSEAAKHECEFNLAWLRELESPEAGAAVAKIYVRSVQVYFATCVGVRSWKQLKEQLKEQPDSIDLVIVDEAGQATIPQTLGPVLLGKRALLIGDERQLPPIGLTGDLNRCREGCAAHPPELAPAATAEPGADAPQVVMRPCWLERSLFEYLWLNHPRIPREMLQMQFRMHPAIADFVAEVFYPEGLTNGVTAEQRHLQFGEFSRAVCVVSTSGQDGHYESSPPGNKPGFWNDLEVKKILQILQRAEASLEGETTFGIVTPYSHQVGRLQAAVQSAAGTFHRVKLNPKTDIASVDRFQGSERDVIIISFVRSPKPCKFCHGAKCARCQWKGFQAAALTFSRDLRRLNVAFSRARKMLILIGDIDAVANPKLRGGLDGALVLQRFVKYARDRGKVLYVSHTAESSHEP